MYGSDAKTASEHLVRLGFLKTAQISKNASGYVVVNSAMVEAIKAYEKERGLAEDGQLSSSTAKKLAEDASNYYELGSRNLTKGMSGTDVSELKNILIDCGVLMGKKKGKYDTTMLDETILEVLEMYLGDNGQEWNGVVNSTVVAFLKGR